MAWYSLRVLGSVSTHTQQKCSRVQNYAPICGFLLQSTFPITCMTCSDNENLHKNNSAFFYLVALV